MLESIVGSIVFEFVGAFSRWLFLSVKNRIRGNGVVSFKKVWGGRKNAKFQESIEHGMSNIGLGMLIIFILLLIGTTFIR